MRKYCRDCGENTDFKPFRSNLFKYKGERVQTCKKCGFLRTQNHRKINEAEMVHLPTQTKYKNMDDK